MYDDWSMAQLREEIIKRGLVIIIEENPMPTKGDLREVLEKNDEYMQSKQWHTDRGQIALVWSWVDVQTVAELDRGVDALTYEQCLNVLNKVKESHNAEQGVNWDVIRWWIDELYPEAPLSLAERAKALYDSGGQDYVFSFAKAQGITDWRLCTACEIESPIHEGSCLVCGSWVGDPA